MVFDPPGVGLRRALARLSLEEEEHGGGDGEVFSYQMVQIRNIGKSILEQVLNKSWTSL